MRRLSALAPLLALLCFVMTEKLTAVDGPLWIPANAPGLQWEGRVRFDNQGAAIYDWTQVGLKVYFTGDRLDLNIATGANYVDVMVDGKIRAIIGPRPEVKDAPLSQQWLDGRDGIYSIAGLGQGEHRGSLVKRTSANYGAVSLRSLRLAPGGRLLPASAPAIRRIEFVGDSLTNGYGNEGPGTACSQLAPYENSSRSWAKLAAEALGAEAQYLAYSGYGVVRNYGEKGALSSEPLPFFYGRTLFGEKAELWDRSKFRPQIAVVFLGTNDYSTQPQPAAQAFLDGYRKLLRQIRDGRGRLPILCLYPADPPAIQGQVLAVRALEEAEGLPTQTLGLPGPLAGELGCDWHPKASVHRRWAILVEAKIGEMMKWTVK